MERPLHGRRFNYEVMWLPLADDGVNIDKLMSCMLYLDSWGSARADEPARHLAYA